MASTGLSSRIVWTGQVVGAEELQGRAKRKTAGLVNATAAAKYGYPLSLWTYDEALRNKVNSGCMLYRAPAQPRRGNHV